MINTNFDVSGGVSYIPMLTVGIGVVSVVTHLAYRCFEQQPKQPSVYLTFPCRRITANVEWIKIVQLKGGRPTVVGHRSEEPLPIENRVLALEEARIFCPQRVVNQLGIASVRARLHQGKQHTLLTQTIRIGCEWEPSPYLITQSMETGSGVAWGQGPRDHYEDAHVIGSFQEVKVTAVFDGHGQPAPQGTCSPGTRAAKFFGNHLLKKLEKHCFDFSDIGLFNGITRACVDLDASYTRYGGATMNAVLQVGPTLWIANLGDCRALFVGEASTVQLSEDAKVEDCYFTDGVYERGGIITRDDNGMARVSGLLNITRSLGDHIQCGQISARPEIVKFPLTYPGYLVQACDGLFDVMTSDAVGDFVRERTKEGVSLDRIAKELVHFAFLEETLDNVTVLITKVDHGSSNKQSIQNHQLTRTLSYRVLPDDS